ncbi:MAG: (2Fe-2S)-binding protein [Pyrinomonadaceae bacterium]|nr:(2Fe-2S)-binding protein [Pyrinomonadaceae bacterium]
METEIKFEPSGRHGITPVGAYLIDVALRFGIRIEDSCGRTGQCDDCAVKIIKGAEFLSQPTQAELEHLSAQRRNNGERLSCQAKIEKAGEICVMTTEKKKPVETTFEAFEKEFSKLPLEEKIQQLLELEKTTLGETLNYILNLPFTVGEKIRDGIAHFGFKMEEEEKKAKRPTEHQEEVKEEKTEVKPEEPKVKKTTATRTAKPKTEAKKPNTRRKTTKSEEKPAE